MCSVCGFEGISEKPSERFDGFLLLKNKRKSAANEKKYSLTALLFHRKSSIMRLEESNTKQTLTHSGKKMQGGKLCFLRLIT